MARGCVDTEIKVSYQYFPCIINIFYKSYLIIGHFGSIIDNIGTNCAQISNLCQFLIRDPPITLGVHLVKVIN